MSTQLATVDIDPAQNWKEMYRSALKIQLNQNERMREMRLEIQSLKLALDAAKRRSHNE
jgi:hypothetical protein